MLTDKNHFIFIRITIGKFHFPMVLPLRCLFEITEGVGDVLSLFKFIDKKVSFVIICTEIALNELRCYGPLDLIDIEVKNKKEHVMFQVLLR